MSTLAPATTRIYDALAKVRNHVRQMAAAERDKDHGSLDVAGEIAFLYEDPEARERWMSELPEIKRTRHRGRPVDPTSFHRFTKWLAEAAGMKGTHAYQLRGAHELVTEFLSATAETIQDASERSLRPLVQFRRFLEKQRTPGSGPILQAVWEDAVRQAGGANPGEAAITRAIAAWKRDNLPKRSQARQHADAMKRDAKLRCLREGRYLISSGYLGTAKEAIDELIRLYREAEASR